jgi:CDP-paratose 2-epimerase
MSRRQSANGSGKAGNGAGGPRPVLITGGAGFIGTNLAHRLATNGERVLIYDNLSRPGVERNLAWLRQTHGERIAVRIADVRDGAALAAAVAGAACVVHLAAQVAVTTSLVDPATDFAINAGGTLNLLEAIRNTPDPAPLIFTSTNKVYGAIEDLTLERRMQRYAAPGAARAYAIDESRPLDFHSPYGCSKGTADQYVLDYARSYGLPAVVFRMSCIYGPHQCGTEDQGWVAHFVLRALKGEPITIYGDGRQVRDVLYVDDLVDAFLLALQHMDALSGQAFNIGGGPENTTSLLELIERIGALHGHRPEILPGAWRTGDQLYYVSDFRKFSQATGWRPKAGIAEGLERLYAWLSERQHAAPAARLRPGEVESAAPAPQRLPLPT